MSAIWQAATEMREAIMPSLMEYKVELDKDPSTNIGGLHAKAAEVRSNANTVRDVVFTAMALNMKLRREAADAAWAYEQAKAVAIKDPANLEVLAKLKTKDEREVAVQQIVAVEYKATVDAQSRLEEWDQFLKMVNLIYYSLSHTREDLNTQVALIKQQMFNGEIKPNKELNKLSSLADLLGADARSLFQSAGVPDETPGPIPVAEGDGEVGWDGAK